MKEKSRTWMFRNLTPEQVAHDPSTAVVCPCPLDTGPLTVRIARSSVVGYPKVLISWLLLAKAIGA